MTRANPPDIADLILRAEMGERSALASLYGMAAAWNKGGKRPPAPLDKWIAGRLDELSKTIRRARNKDTDRALHADALRALLIQRKGKRGRPSTRRTQLCSRAYAQDVWHLVKWEQLSETAACAKVADRQNVSPKTVEKAWQMHADELQGNSPH